MNKNFFSRILALASAFVMIMSLGISPASAASNDIIDMSRTGSITLYKYDLTAAEQGGVNVSQFTATGAKDTAAESALGKYALQGVQYDYLRAGDMMTYSNAGSIQDVYNVPNTLRSILGLTNADAVTHQGDTYYYTSDQYNDALADLLTDNTAGKDKLEAWVASAGAKHMAETDKNGKTSVSNLKLGLYMVIETAVPEEVYSTTDPFFVSVPMTDSIADNWFYDVTVYPKNQTNNPTINKLVSENGEFADTATVSEGDVIDYRLVSQLPTISSTATYLSQYTYEDVLSKGLTYNKDAVVSFYANKDDAENGTGTPIDVWTSKTNPTMFSVSYETVTGGSKMTLNPTKDGFNEINKHYSDKYMVVSYTATVTSTADMVCGDTGNENTVELTYSRTNSTYTNTIEDKTIVYTYGLHLVKTFSDNQGDATKVRFVVRNATDNYFVTATGSDGVYYVTGQAAAEKDATVFSPDADGNLIINGMEGDVYVLTEIGTDAGYSLLKAEITIEIKPTDTTILASKAAVTGIGSTQPAVSVVMNNSAAAAVDNNETAMSADRSSDNALVDIEVLNSRTFVLPQTGGAGVWAVSIAGVAGCAIGAYLLMKGKKAA